MPFYNFEVRTETHVMITDGVELATATRRGSKQRSATSRTRGPNLG